MWSGKIKQYNDYGHLIFDGEYANGEKNGKGKEYDTYGNLLFEGEYLNGKRWNGKGKEDVTIYGGITFEGEYLNGQIWNGKVIEYGCGYYNDIIFNGEYFNGKRWNGKVFDYISDNKFIINKEYIKGKIVKEEKIEKKKFVIRFYKKQENNLGICVPCFKNEKISTAIEKYRNKTSDYGDNVYFFQSKKLNPNLTIEEAGITDKSQIYVIRVSKSYDA